MFVLTEAFKVFDYFFFFCTLEPPHFPAEAAVKER